MQAWLPQETEVELAQEAAEVGSLILAAADRCSQGGWRVQPHSNTATPTQSLLQCHSWPSYSRLTSTRNSAVVAS